MTRMAYHKFFHPKEALITNGVLNRELASAAGKPSHTPSDDVTMATTQRYIHKSFALDSGASVSQLPLLCLPIWSDTDGAEASCLSPFLWVH